MLLLIPASPFSAADTPLLWHWVQSGDGQKPDAQGNHANTGNWPADTERVLVVPVQQLSYHQVVLPKVNAPRLPAVLAGLLEERLLDDPEQLHMALAPGAVADGCTPIWVAVCQRVWLQRCLQALEQAQQPVSRIVPAIAPKELPQLAVYADLAGDFTHWHLCGPHGLVTLAWPHNATPPPSPPSATLLRGLAPWPQPAHTNTLWPDELYACADNASTGLAECTEPALRWHADSLVASWLRAARSDWNLAQFEFKLSASTRRRQWAQRTLRQLWQDPVWRATRWGMVSLTVVQLIGLNLNAWQERLALNQQQQAVRQTLTQTFPHVTLVLDAPLQMQRELDQLRERQGNTTGHDLESLLQAVGLSQQNTPWHYQQLDFNPERTILRGVQLPSNQANAIQARLAQHGWHATLQGADMQLRPTGTTP